AKEAFRVLTVLILFVALFISFKKLGVQRGTGIFGTTYLIYLFVVVGILIYRMLWSGESVFKVMKAWDYNMLAMYILTGIVLIIGTLKNNNYRLNMILYNLYLVVLIGLLLLTASRRGLIGLGFLLLAGLVF